MHLINIVYFSSLGKRLYVGIGGYYWRSAGRAVIISPSITKLTQLCSLVFFYRLQVKGKAALSLYIQTGTAGLSDLVVVKGILLAYLLVVKFLLQPALVNTKFPIFPRVLVKYVIVEFIGTILKSVMAR